MLTTRIATPSLVCGFKSVEGVARGVFLTCLCLAAVEARAGVCDPTVAPTADPSGIRQNRYISFTPTNGGMTTAIRVKLVDLQNFTPPPAPRNFSAFEFGASCTDPGGCVRWVGPPTVSPDEPPVGTTFNSARLQCTPHYQDWAGVGLLRVYGSETVPSSTYDVQHLESGCDEGMEVDYSPVLVAGTARWGDVVASFTPPQPDAIDLANIVSKWRGLAGPPGKWQLQLNPNVPDPVKRIDMMDIVLGVDAFKLLSYSLRGPIACPYPPSCPDGVVDRGEECDDGNATNGDGCNSVCRAETRTAVVSLVPILPYGTGAEPYPPGTVILGNDIFLQQGGLRVWMELRLSDWDVDLDGSPRLRTWQIAIDADGYTSGDAGVLAPAFQACAATADCTAALGPDSSCNTPTAGRCAPGFRDDQHPAGFPSGAQAAFDLSVPGFRIGVADGASDTQGVIDPGTDVYAATLVLDIPDEARGRFTIGFDQSLLNTFLFNGNAPRGPIPIMTFRPAVITVVGKNRFLTISNPPPVVVSAGGPTAIRVRMIDLQNPDPPNSPLYPPPDFSAFESAMCTAVGELESCSRWVGPPATFLEAQDLPDLGGFRCARLQCTPYYRDWASEPRFHVTAPEIVPSSFYEVESLASTCVGIENVCADVSAPVLLFTARSGDVTPQYAPPALTTQPDALDVGVLLLKFKKQYEIENAAAKLSPNVLRLDIDVDALDILACVNAFVGFAYAQSGPCACPSSVPCDGTMCVDDAACRLIYGTGALCMRKCNGGANDGLPCGANEDCNYCAGGTRDGFPCPAGTGDPCPGGGTCSVDGVCGPTSFCRDRCGRCFP